MDKDIFVIMFKNIFHLAGRIATPIFANNSRPLVQNISKFNLLVPSSTRSLCTILNQKLTDNGLFKNYNLPEIHQETVRTLTKYSWGKGKRKSVKAVLRRFYRLQWGGWIRTRCGKAKKLWKKSSARKRRLRQHIFCNATQSTLLDKMAGKYWTKPKYYVDDPYEPYHTREEFVYTAKKPRPYIPPEERY